MSSPSDVDSVIRKDKNDPTSLMMLEQENHLSIQYKSKPRYLTDENELKRELQREDQAKMSYSSYYNHKNTQNGDTEFDKFTPYIGSPHSVTSESYLSKYQLCMRRVLQFTFFCCIIMFISPLIFFIFGASEIVGEYARVNQHVRKHHTGDSKVKNITHYPSIHEICLNQEDCIRYYFFLGYMITFIAMFICCVILFAIRKNRHPLKSRSCAFVALFCTALPFWVIWACVGLMYAPSWMGCANSHSFNNIMYPLLILPYFFRAYRIKKIYDEAHNYNQYHNTMNIFRSARNYSIISAYNTMEDSAPTKHSSKLVNMDTHSQSSFNPIKKQDSNKANYCRKKSFSLNSQIDSNTRLKDAVTVSKNLEKLLLKWFLVAMFPFIMLSVTNYIFPKYHLLPTFIKSCDKKYASVALFMWGAVHLLEIGILILVVYWIRLVWRAFSVKQELMIVAVVDMVFCACMIGFNPTKDTINDGVIILYLTLMRAIGFFMITILLPLYKTYFQANYLPAMPTQDVITSLQAILDDMDACVFFRQFMTEQDSQHLLDFWMEVDLFKDACANDEIDDIQGAASKMFRKYFDLKNHSKQAMSIKHILNSRNKNYCKAMSKVFQEDDNGNCRVEIHDNIFDHPHRVIFEHMENVHYRLFLRSVYCKQLLSSVAGQEEIFRKLINEEIL